MKTILRYLVPLFIAQTLALTFGCTGTSNKSAENNDSTTELAQETGKEKIQTSGAVDLGLSVKWAACNIGADKPEDFGDCFAWGETGDEEKPGTGFSVDNYSLLGQDLCDYIPFDDDSGEGYDVLSKKHDAATNMLGKEWSMPTDEDFDELFAECTWTWTEYNGSWGYLIKSNKNGNAIFLPAAGYCHFVIEDENTHGYYWTSIPTDDIELSHYLDFDKDTYMIHERGKRWNGFHIRAILNK